MIRKVAVFVRNEILRSIRLLYAIDKPVNAERTLGIEGCSHSRCGITRSCRITIHVVLADIESTEALVRCKKHVSNRMICEINGRHLYVLRGVREVGTTEVTHVCLVLRSLSITISNDHFGIDIHVFVIDVLIGTEASISRALCKGAILEKTVELSNPVAIRIGSSNDGLCNGRGIRVLLVPIRNSLLLEVFHLLEGKSRVDLLPVLDYFDNFVPQVRSDNFLPCHVGIRAVFYWDTIFST